MPVFEYGDYKIQIDAQATKAYMQGLAEESTQADRNWQKYVQQEMTDAEKTFFASLQIDPEMLQVDGDLYQNKRWECTLSAYIIGEFVSYPDILADFSNFSPNAAAAGKTMPGDITVGHFNVHINTPQEWEPGCDMPENAICIDIKAAGLPWLLNEKCENRQLPAWAGQMWLLFSGIVSFLPNRIADLCARRRAKKALKAGLEKLQSRCSVSCQILSQKEVMHYKKRWFAAFCPPDAQKEAYALCVDNREFATYLWHLFSFEILKSADRSDEKFASVHKEECTLFLSCGQEMAVHLSAAQNITKQDLSELCENTFGWSDFVVTADDFSWTYAKPHEEDLGPYFYQKGLKQ